MLRQNGLADSPASRDGYKPCSHGPSVGMEAPLRCTFYRQSGLSSIQHDSVHRLRKPTAKYFVLWSTTRVLHIVCLCVVHCMSLCCSLYSLWVFPCTSVVPCMSLCCLLYVFVLFAVCLCVVRCGMSLPLPDHCMSLCCSLWYVVVLFIVCFCVVHCISLCCSLYVFVLFIVFALVDWA